MGEENLRKSLAIEGGKPKETRLGGEGEERSMQSEGSSGPAKIIASAPQQIQNPGV